MYSAPVDLSAPPNSLGAANAHGYVQIWQEIDEVDFGGGLKLPLRLRFSSEPQQPSPLAGMGWWCPLTEAKAYLKREKMLRAELICGKVMYLRRDKTDASRFLSLDEQWTAVIDKEKITVSRADGWELRYEGGRLKQLRTDSGRVLTWFYKGNVLDEIREEGTANGPLRIVTGPERTPAGVLLNGKLHSFALTKRPRIEKVSGQFVVGGFDNSLEFWQKPDATRYMVSYESDSDLNPLLKVKDFGGADSSFKIDRENSRILFSAKLGEEWSYKIGNTKDGIELPTIDRYDDVGRKEFIYVNPEKGTTESLTLTQGHMFKEAFTAAGPLYGKIRYIRRILAGGDFEYVFKASYDSAGRLVRKVDRNGFTTVYSYTKDGSLEGKSVSPPQDEKLIKALNAKADVLRAQVDQIREESARDEAIQKLALFYILKMGKVEPALALLSAVKGNQIAFNIQANAVDHNPSFSPLQKVEAFKLLKIKFPEQSLLLDAAILGRSEEAKQYEK
jgi:YD repeat-containing protein